MGKLDTYSGPWTVREARHLLRRVCFGYNPQQVVETVNGGMAAAITTAFESRPRPLDPVDPATGDPFVTGALDGTKPLKYYNRIIKAWWIGLMLEQRVSIVEKVTLMWSNHFATEMEAVRQPQMSYQLLAYLRANGLKSIRDMVRQVTIEPAMLRYLNGNVNTKGNPNENYARELQELFTIGKGKEVAPGDYSTYTEEDVRAVARVLTGWRDTRSDLTVTFNAKQHDTANKQLSLRYQNRIIQGRTGNDAGQQELDDLLSVIFDQQETARHMVRVMYRWFVNSGISADIEAEVIEPLAAMLRTNDYVVAPVLRRLLSSEHFFDADTVASQIRNPADFVIGMLRATALVLPAEPNARFVMLDTIATSMAAQQMDLNDPPSVAGWEAYYQQPDLHRMWLTTATLPLRNGFTDGLLTNLRGLGRNVIDSVEVAASIAEASDAFVLVDELNARYFTVPFPEQTRQRLVNDVLQGGTSPSYEWTQQWLGYLDDPTIAKRAAVKAKLDTLMKYMFRMAEFQLG